MRLFFFVFFSGFFVHSAFATQDVNSLSCLYKWNSKAWESFISSYVPANYDLSAGDTRVASGGWTSGKDPGQNFAYCNLMVGTDEDAVDIVTVLYRGDQFNPVTTVDGCAVTGKNYFDWKKDRSVASWGVFGSGDRLDSS